MEGQLGLEPCRPFVRRAFLTLRIATLQSHIVPLSSFPPFSPSYLPASRSFFQEISSALHCLGIRYRCMSPPLQSDRISIFPLDCTYIGLNHYFKAFPFCTNKMVRSARAGLTLQLANMVDDRIIIQKHLNKLEWWWADLCFLQDGKWNQRKTRCPIW